MFYTNMGVFNEGKQAEEYKRRKEEERERQEDAIEERDWRRYSQHNLGDKMTPRNPNFASFAKDVKEKNTDELDTNLGSHVLKGMSDDRKRRGKVYETLKDGPHYRYSYDAVNKHLRRHPEKLKEDCGIFESIELV